MFSRQPPYLNQGENNPSNISIAAIADRTRQMREDSNAALVGASDVIGLNRRGGFQQVQYDLSNAVAPNIGETGKVWRIVHALQGTVAGSIIDVDLGPGGIVSLYPGDYLDGPMEQFQLLRNSLSVNTGIARLILCKQPDAKFNSLNSRGNAGGALERVTSTQTYNVTTNTPSLATEGISINGDTGLRVVINGSNGGMPGTITGGTVRYWFYDPALAVWALSTFEYTLPTGVQYAVLPDEIVSVAEGRFFAEIRSLTTSLGNPSPVALLRTFGV